MCGIYAVKGEGAIRLAYSGLQKLEYRGYDSCGMGYIDKGEISVVKSVGYVKTLEDTGVLGKASDIVIAHTRWATTGGVTVSNSHPHISASGRYAIVHNGIIENYLELKEEYLLDVEFAM